MGNLRWMRVAEYAYRHGGPLGLALLVVVTAVVVVALPLLTPLLLSVISMVIICQPLGLLVLAHDLSRYQFHMSTKSQNQNKLRHKM